MSRRWSWLVGLPLAAAFLYGAAQPGTGRLSDGPPPLRFQHNTRLVVQTLDEDRVDAACRRFVPTSKLPPADTILACHRAWVIYMPNPCAFPSERYAAILCHEQGHANSWSGRHEP